MPIVHESLVAMLAELAREAAIIIKSYMDDDERCEDPVLEHYGPFTIQVHGIDGHLATFYEEGIEFFPESKTSDDIAELVAAIVHTAEYVGNDVLPVEAGWSWYDALVKYAPEEAARFARNPIHFPTSTDSQTGEQ